MKTVKAYFGKDEQIPFNKLLSCECCDEENSKEVYVEEVPRGYVWTSYCHSCRYETSGYEF
ncbi:hypothetical protein FZC71_01135 [Bacillus subtilis]|nr:hypothetical protein FZC71_01135 [Bacillus subtilis]